MESNSVQALQQQGTLPGLSNLHNTKLNNRVAEPAAGQNRKQQQGYARLPAHQQPGSGTPFSSDGTESSGSDRAVCDFEQRGHSSLDQRLRQATHKHALDAGGNGMQEPAALVWSKKQKRRRASPAESDPADSHASKAHNPALARVNRVPQRQQQSNPRRVLASLPANQMREVEPQGICTIWLRRIPSEHGHSAVHAHHLLQAVQDCGTLCCHFATYGYAFWSHCDICAYTSYNIACFHAAVKYIHTLLPLMCIGYLAAPNVVNQSAALDALPAKVPLQSGISFDPSAIEAFIKSLHERE